MSALLALEDGKVFFGKAFGASGTAVGEVCFNTSMTGYQEVLTDPSYRGQIVAMTAPQIGNTGTNGIDVESPAVQVRAFVVEEVSPVPSNWRSEQTLGEYLAANSIPGIEGIDTRALTRHLRTRGAMRACVTTDGLSPDEAVAKAQGAAYDGVDFVSEVTARESYEWDANGESSREWIQSNPARESESEVDAMGNTYLAAVPTGPSIVAVDFGTKKNILRSLRKRGLRVTVVPAHTKASEIMALQPAGVFLSNGPGDPAALEYAHRTVSELIGQIPLFGICLGHQILGCAVGAKTFKLKFGHRGANQPVKDLRTGKVAITSQNHGYAIDPETLPSDMEVTHINLNDGTVAGIAHRSHPVAGVQFHPEASPGPREAADFFDQFAESVARAGSNC